MVKNHPAGVILLFFLLGFQIPVRADVPANRRDAFLSKFEAGESAFGQKRFQDAVRYFQDALVVQPGQVRPRFRLGQALQALGRHQESVAQFNALLEQHPNHITARVGLAQSLIAMGLTGEAHRQLQWILQVQPEHAEARELMARHPVEPGQDRNPVAATGGNPEPTGPSATTPVVPDGSPEAPEQIPTGFRPLPMRPGIVVEDESAAAEAAPNPEGSPPAGSGKPAREASRPVPPAARTSDTWKVTDFLDQTRDSFGVALEYAKFCIEKGDLVKAGKFLTQSEELAVQRRDTRRFLEVQIHRSLLNLYRSEIRDFGQQLLKIKPLLSRDTYHSFLDIYNRASQASSPADVARLVGGVALGAEHYAVAAAIFGEVLRSAPDDLFVSRLLAEAQLGQRDYAGAEKTFLDIARSNPKSAEGAMNLAKFYLTARFDPDAASRYLRVAGQLEPDDQRVPVMRALLACVQGRLKEGRAGLEQGLAGVRDPQVQLLARRVLEEADAVRMAGGQVDYRSLLALPGSRGPSAGEMKIIGEDQLKRGSFFAALKSFHEAQDLAEIGRCYLAIASQLFANGDEEASALAAGFGLRALNEELKKNPASSRADLYLALYHFERREQRTAKTFVEAGLRGQAEPETRRHLRLLYGKLKG